MKEKWTLDQVPDLKGKTFIVTGANSGIGFEAARVFAEKGAQLVLACRDRKKGEMALQTIMEDTPKARAELMCLDLASLDSISKFAQEFKSKYKKLDVLLNNAGIMMSPFEQTFEGFELQFGTNHLGHFALTGLLLDRIKSSPGARVVNISSMAHKMGSMDFRNLMFVHGRGYRRTRAYGRSKLANLLFTYELNRRFQSHSIDAIALAAHPGVSRTNLSHYLENKVLYRLAMNLLSNSMQSASMGALPGIRACVDPSAAGGQYYGPDGFMEMKGYPVLVQSTRASHNEKHARRLWKISERLTGVPYLD